MFIGPIRFGTYQTIILGPQESSTEKRAAFLFHSTRLTNSTNFKMEADSSSGSCPQKVFPGHELSVAIKRESLTLFI